MQISSNKTHLDNNSKKQGLLGYQNSSKNEHWYKIVLILVLILSFKTSQALAFDLFKNSPKSEQGASDKTDSNQEDSSENNSNKVTTEEVNPANFTNIAVLQGLNKVTAKSSHLEVRVGGEIEFGKLIIKAKQCWKSTPDQRPENKILLEIEEVNNAGSKALVFYGWMFSSSPSISGLENPIYDITAIECKN